MADGSSSITKPRGGGIMAIPRALSMLIPRSAYAGMLGMAFDGKRDMYAAFGYEKDVKPENILARYARGGIAKRIVDAYPDATWGAPPDIVSSNTAFTTAWNTLINEFDIWSALRRLDVLSRLGMFAIMVIGTDRPNLERQLSGARKLTYLQPYGEVSARVKTYSNDQTSPRFQLPQVYEILATNERNQNLGIQTPTGSPTRANFDVHYSRVVHVAQGILEDETFGSSTLLAVWNYLVDLEKVVGASAENFWTSANRGMQLDVDKEMDMDDESEKALSDEVDEYIHNLRRVIRTRGIKINELGGETASPKDNVDVIIDLISGTTGIPRRILLGTESGHLASTQDKGNWAERVEEYRTLVATPYILDPFVWRLVDAGLLPDPGVYEYIWPDAYRLGPLERGQQSAQTSRTASNLVRAAKDWQSMAVQRKQLSQLPPPGEAPQPSDAGTGAGNTSTGGGATQNGNVPTVNEDRTPAEDAFAHQQSGHAGSGTRGPNSGSASSGGGTGNQVQNMPVDLPDIPDMILSTDEIRGIIGLSTDNRLLDTRTRVKGKRRT